MAFLDDLRKHLLQPEPVRPTFTPDLAAHRRHLVAALEELEESGRGDREVQWFQSYWSDRIAPFAVKMGALLLESMAYGTANDEITVLINASLSRHVKLDVTLGSRVKDRELDRLRELAIKTADKAAKGYQEPCQIIAQYVREIRAVTPSGESRTVTPIGRLLLELPDRDAVRWMLTVEALQSRGRDDPWRLSRRSALEIVRMSSGLLHYDGREGPWPATWETLERLSKSGILTVIDDEKAKTTTFELLPDGRHLLEEIANGENTPFTVLADALLQDETSVALGQVRPAAAFVQSEGAAAANTRHARMVAHEIRNALVPVRDALLRAALSRQSCSILCRRSKEHLPRSLRISGRARPCIMTAICCRQSSATEIVLHWPLSIFSGMRHRHERITGST